MIILAIFAGGNDKWDKDDRSQNPRNWDWQRYLVYGEQRLIWSGTPSIVQDQNLTKPVTIVQSQEVSFSFEVGAESAFKSIVALGNINFEYSS